MKQNNRFLPGSYVNKDGQKVYTTEVILDDQEFADSKGCLLYTSFLQCACRFTEQIAKERAAAGEAVNGGDIVHTSKRQEMKELIARLRKNSPFIDANIMKSVENIKT